MAEKRDEAWKKLCERRALEEATRKFDFRGMEIGDIHVWELEAEKTLRKLDPNHPALKYYGSTFKAIEAYEDAIAEIKGYTKKVGNPISMDEMTVEDMKDRLGELYHQKFGGSLEELKKKPSHPSGLNPGLDRCTIMGITEDKDIEIHFQDTPECSDEREEYQDILKAALGGGETIYKTLK